MRPLGSPKELQTRRERAIGLLEKGHMPVEVARVLGVDRRSVRRWKAVFSSQGVHGIWAKSVPGRPSKLTAMQKRRLEHILLKGAASSGFNTDLWTCPRIVKVIRAEFGISYHVDHVCRLLHNMGWSPQRPQRKAMERDEAEIMRWIREEWPRVKKKPTE